MLVVAAAYGVYSFFLRSRPVPFQNFSVNKVTETGKAKLVAISPDGKYILNVVEDKGQQSLWLRNVPTNSNTQVMPPEPVQYLGVRFSPDGNYLYFVRGEPGEALKYLYRAPVLGGTPQKLVTDVDTNITFSPDGRSLAYTVMNNPELGKFRLVIYSLETGEAKTLVTGSMSQAIIRPGLVARRQEHRLCGLYNQGCDQWIDGGGRSHGQTRPDLRIQRRALVQPGVVARWQRFAGAISGPGDQFQPAARLWKFPIETIRLAR